MSILIGKRDILKFRNTLCALLRGSKGKELKLCCFRRKYDAFQPIELTLSAACLFRFYPCFILANEFFCLTDMILLFFISMLKCCAALIFYAYVMCIIPVYEVIV